MTSHESAERKGERPLLPDEVAKLPDVPATDEVPKEVAAGLAEHRLHIAGVPGKPDAAKLLRSAGKDDDGWELVLPESAFLGQPGRSAEMLQRGEHDLPKQLHTAPFRPDWAAQSFQARDASDMTARPPMRRIKGRQVEPYYGVYPPDVRQVFYPGPYPWRCVGRIFTWTNWAGGGGWNWWGSGVLVGPRHVVTAGHVCPWGSGSWAMKFVPGYWDGSPAYGAGAQSWTSDYRGWDTNKTVAANDIAVLRLYDPIGSWLGWMGTKVYDSSWQNGPYWTLAGYPAAIAGGERPSYQSGIPVLDDDNEGDAKEIEHHGSATGGDSGGPFFGFWNDGPYSVGATSGGEAITGTPFGWWNEDNNIEAGGKAMVDLALWAQANWP
jgi:V8-like Glu-specific endopeptidase